MSTNPSAATTGTGSQAWQFTPESFGAKRDGRIITDATITGGALSTLTSASAPFTSADTGKRLILASATPQAFTITFVNATTVTLSVAAAGAVTGIGAVFGSDDTAAIQSAVNAATAYAQISGHGSYGEVVFTPGLYCVAGPAVIGGATAGNAQVTLPVVTASAGYKIYLTLRGSAAAAAAPEHWLNPNVNVPGATLVCMRTDGTYDAANGPACVIGGPVNGYGGGNGTYSNVCVKLDGLTVLVPYTTTYGGFMLWGMAQADVGDVSVMPMAVVPAAQPWPQLVSGGPATNQYTPGLIMPAVGNNALNKVNKFISYGTYIGLMGCDHLTVDYVATIYCGVGWIPGKASAGVNHAAAIRSWCCEATNFPIYMFAAALWTPYQATGAAVHVSALQLESYASGQIVGADNTTTAGDLYGVIHFEDLNFPGGIYGHALAAAGCNVRLWAMYQQPTVIPITPGASPFTWSNFWYRDIAVTVSGGTVSAIAVDATTTGLTAGTFLIPPGHTLTITFTVAPTVNGTQA